MSQVKDLEFQSAKARADFYELKEFVDKIKLMYKETLGVENSKNKK
jgi:hypothetical protein